MGIGPSGPLTPLAASPPATPSAIPRPPRQTITTAMAIYTIVTVRGGRASIRGVAPVGEIFAPHRLQKFKPCVDSAPHTGQYILPPCTSAWFNDRCCAPPGIPGPLTSRSHPLSPSFPLDTRALLL